MCSEGNRLTWEGAVGLRRLIRTMLLFCGLVAVGCASDDVVADKDTTTPADVESTSSIAAPTTSAASEFDCPDTTTTTSASTTTGLPTVCELIEAIPPDELPSAGARDYVVWSGTISGSIQAPGCDAVSQSGQIVLVVFSDGDVSGAGETVSGEYGCDDGASIPEMMNSYGIDGRMTDVFTLTFTDGVQVSSGPIEDGRALVTQDTGFGIVTIELSCESC
jgi:hypothetical protein